MRAAEGQATEVKSPRKRSPSSAGRGSEGEHQGTPGARGRRSENVAGESGGGVRAGARGRPMTRVQWSRALRPRRRPPRLSTARARAPSATPRPGGGTRGPRPTQGRRRRRRRREEPTLSPSAAAAAPHTRAHSPRRLSSEGHGGAAVSVTLAARATPA